MTLRICTIVPAWCCVAAALGVTVPVTENFVFDAAAWRDSNGITELVRLPDQLDLREMLENDLSPYSYSKERRLPPRGQVSERGRDPYDQDANRSVGPERPHRNTDPNLG